MYALICFLIFMTGSCFGSFLHVCLSRSGWLTGRSRCDNCGYTLKWYDLIPIFSYIALRGKCRKCKEKISSSHFVSELMMGASFLCSFFCFRFYGIEYGITVFTGLSFMAAAAIQDYIEREIYTVTLLGGIICTAITRVIHLYLDERYYGAIQFVAALFIMKMLFILLSEVTQGKLGNGDYDLFIIMFCICGVYGAVYALTAACIIGCVIYVPLLLTKKIERNKQLPFAPLLLLGTLAELIIKMFV